jgi:tetratricopeptide (TPR) repeat protein
MMTLSRVTHGMAGNPGPPKRPRRAGGRRALRAGAIALGIALVGASAREAAAVDFVRETIPHKWVERMMPEDLPEQKYPAYFNALDKARFQSFTGRYKLSLMTLRKHADPKPDELPQIAMIRADSLSALGRWQQALEALSDPAVADRPEVVVRKARVLLDSGKPAEARTLLEQAIQAHPRSIGGHYLLGVVCERLGDLEGAKQAYGWFVAEPQDYLGKWQSRGEVKEFASAENVVTIGQAIDRWASLTEEYRKNRNLHNVLLGMFVRAYDVIDREYWPARVAAAEYFLWHDQKDKAAEELVVALNANPHDAAALRLIGLINGDSYGFDKADRAVETIRKVNPDSTVADLLEARNLLQQRRPKEAEAPLSRVLSAQPDNLEALGLLAGTYALQLLDDKTAEMLARVEKVDPDNATAYLEVAEQLGAMRQYPRAADKYKVAIERAPWWTAPRNGLGLLYTQSGDEDDARTVLLEARELDAYNLATTNYLTLLDEMAAYARRETEHFVIVYDEQQDPLIGEYFGDYMESIHAEVTSQFKHDPSFGGRPEKKTLIEVFPSHDAFSVRTTGSPWIPTVGASTGRVIALASPADKAMGTYNWAAVLRHEYTHTVTLSATDNRIQHWMTEGLAVFEERTPMRWEWVPMLYSAVKKKNGLELFTLDGLTWGFVRPKKPVHRQLAYAQSFWVCQYVEETWGHDAILRMLEEFKNAGRMEEVFPKITGKTMSQFETDFFAWCDKQVASWGYDEETSKKVEELTKLAEELVQTKQYAEAVAAWEEIHKLRPVDALPHKRLAGLYLHKSVNQTDKGVEHLTALHKVEIKDNRYAKRIARIQRDAGKLDAAQQFALEAVYIDPYDLSAHELLAEVYEKAGNAAGLEREQRVIPVLKKWKAERTGDPVAPPDGAGAEKE